MRTPGVRFEVPDPPPDATWVMGRFPTPPGLYLHIPFCRTLCPFCPYNKVCFDPDLAAGFGHALLAEVDAYLTADAGPFPSLYVGGGTPTLCLDLVTEVAGRVEVTGERAIEMLPSHLTGVTALELARIGFDAVSLGVQSFDADVLRHLHRPTTVRQNLTAVEVAVGRFACVDVDLIFDTVFARPEVLLTDLATCFAHGVDQVSTYPLIRFGFTPFGTGEHDRRREHRLLRQATELAAAHGYERRSVWTFNRIGGPTYSSITRPRYLGFGAGAASYTGPDLLVNHFGLRQYTEALARGRLPIARHAHLSPLAADAYQLFWQLYTGVLPAGSFDEGSSGRHLLRAAVGLARTLGWVRRDADGDHLTPRGYDRYHDLERWVTSHLIEPLWAELHREHDEAPAADGPAPAATGTG